MGNINSLALVNCEKEIPPQQSPQVREVTNHKEIEELAQPRAISAQPRAISAQPSAISAQPSAIFESLIEENYHEAVASFHESSAPGARNEETQEVSNSQHLAPPPKSAKRRSRIATS